MLASEAIRADGLSHRIHQSGKEEIPRRAESEELQHHIDNVNRLLSQLTGVSKEPSPSKSKPASSKERADRQAENVAQSDRAFSPLMKPSQPDHQTSSPSESAISVDELKAQNRSLTLQLQEAIQVLETARGYL